MNKKIKITMLCILVIISQVTGCMFQKENKKDGTEYKVYYVNQAGNQLVEHFYYTKETDRESLIGELMDALNKQPEDAMCPIPKGVSLINYRVENNIAYFNFNTFYQQIDKTLEVLCRAAIVKTISQVATIEGVIFEVADQPLMDSTGNLVGKMVDSDFVDTIARDINAIEFTQLAFYYTNETGDQLLKYETPVTYASDFSIEKYLLEELIKGPEKEGYYPTLPKNLKVISVTVKDNICYVNFDDTFLTEALQIKDYIPIYSVVNSLSELPNIRKVQILVNGASNIKFKDSISLEKPLDRNLDYVGGEKN